MTVILVLIFIVALAAGAVAGCLATIEHFERLAAQQRADEEELAETEELYEAWAMLRRPQLPPATPADTPRRPKWPEI